MSGLGPTVLPDYIFPVSSFPPLDLDRALENPGSQPWDTEKVEWLLQKAGACRAQERGWEENRRETIGETSTQRKVWQCEGVLFLTQMCCIATVSLGLVSAVALTRSF